jgi:3-hydroxyacyl-[acyl-carrier-protein] dehydratase
LVRQVNDNFFPGHFPTRPLMPGVLQVEAMAQVGGLVMLTPEVGGSKDNFFFGGVDACRFRKPVLPGDTLVMKVELVKLNKRFGVAKMKAQAFVGDKLACEVRARLLAWECTAQDPSH